MNHSGFKKRSAFTPWSIYGKGSDKESQLCPPPERAKLCWDLGQDIHLLFKKQPTTVSFCTPKTSPARSYFGSDPFPSLSGMDRDWKLPEWFGQWQQKPERAGGGPLSSCNQDGGAISMYFFFLHSSCSSAANSIFPLEAPSCDWTTKKLEGGGKGGKDDR